MKEAVKNGIAYKIAKWKDFVSKNFSKVKISKQKDFYILTALLLTILFKFDRSAAINFIKILFTFTLSQKIMKNQFLIIINSLNKNGKNLFEYTLSIVFTFFIFVEIDFLLNRLYTHALLALIFLLGFVIAFFYLIEKGKHPDTSEGKYQAKN